MELRPYQRDAVDAVWRHIAASDTNPAVVLPTGSGKTHVIAELCRDAVQKWDGRVIVLAHVKELLEQAAGKLRAVAPDLPIGVFSAGLGRRDIGYAVTIAGIQSVYQRAHDLGPFDLVIVDEAHLIPPDGEGMYRRFLTDARDVCAHQRVVGLTATPYRMKTGTICAPENVLHEVCFEAGVRELIVQGYLCPLKSRAGKATADTSDLHVRGGEFVAGELEDRMDEAGLVARACAEVVTATRDRRATLIFASGVRHGRHIARVLNERHGLECGFVCGETPTKERDELIDRFKSGNLHYLANVNVLTTGFDAPNVDCVAMLRPTMSPGLYYQMVGRGFRLAPGKTECLVLDFGGNVLRHGPVDAIRLADTNGAPGEAPAKQCPECDALIHAAYAICPECGHVFPPRQP
ncbi:MAG: DEAD/DEAH box helicase [Alphaproteobacteria bacterium]|nr:MAG: DEAD/DEAH box helicase [Alphaproteobacteria bacterium]